MLLLLCFLITTLVGINCQSSWSTCGNTSYYGASGVISSRNYPSERYLGNSNCSYRWYVPTLSSVSLTFQSISIEYSNTCLFDWVELSCRSHSVSVPLRYCGMSTNRSPITFAPCTEVVIQFKSDNSAEYNGFSIAYRADPIECADNCTLLTNSFGYVCSCSANGTSVAMPTMAPTPQCAAGCSLSTSLSSLFCLCAVHDPTCPHFCGLSYDYDIGGEICDCNETATDAPNPCAPGCYRMINYLGLPYCSCPPTIPPPPSPLSCPYGCYVDTGYWGNQFCNCPASSQPPIWCSSGCVSDTDSTGARYCRCPPTTLPPCPYPCFYNWDYTDTYAGRMVCFCPPTTTTPPPTGCNQTLTATYGIVTSPNYPNPYTRDIDCYQYIAVPMATTFTIRVLDIDVYNVTNCEFDYVEIIGCDGSNTRFCFANTIPASGVVMQCSDDSPVIIKFHSFFYYYAGFRGFKLSYSAGFTSDCGDSGNYLSQGSTGIVASPNFPNNFPGFSECFKSLFTDEENIRIRITFDQLRLEDSTTCTDVFLKLTCDEDVEQTKTVCGSRIPAPMYFDCQSLQIWFKSNATTAFSPRNYKLRFYAVARSPSTAPSTLQPQSQALGFQSGDESDLPQSSKIGIGLGVGVGGFFLLILIVIIIVIVFSFQRQVARRERHHREDIAVICRNMSGRSSDASGSIRLWRSSPGSGGFVNQAYDTPRSSSEQLPSYHMASDQASSVGGFVAEQSKSELLA